MFSPEMSKCIYLLTTPDCLLWLKKKKTWKEGSRREFMHKLNSQKKAAGRVSVVLFWLSSLTGDDTAVCLHSHPVNHFIHPAKLPSVVFCSSTKLSSPVVSCMTCLSLTFSVLSHSHTHSRNYRARMAEIKQSNVSHTHTHTGRGFDGISCPRLTSQYSLHIALNVCHSPEEFTQEQRLLRIQGESRVEEQEKEECFCRQQETMHANGRH